MCMKKNSFMIQKITIMESIYVYHKVFCGEKTQT